jgi:uncharacterized membrane protein YqaE (UPF0057 family)
MSFKLDEEKRLMDAVTYSLEHATATVELSLAAGRLIVKTQGRGLIDKPHTIDIPLSDLKNFCLVPTIGTQQRVSRSQSDYSYDSEFIFSYQVQGKLKKKRIFVNGEAEAFQKFLASLESNCPAASLLQLDPAAAQKQIGVISAAKTVRIILFLLIGVPVLLTALYLIYLTLTGRK